MKIHYNSVKLEKILTDLRLLKKFYGKDHIKISHRLSELRVANNLNEIPDVPPPRRHKLSSNYKDCWGIDYSKNYRIILRPIGKFDINDLTSITEVEIVDMEDYH